MLLQILSRYRQKVLESMPYRFFYI